MRKLLIPLLLAVSIATMGTIGSIDGVPIGNIGSIDGVPIGNIGSYCGLSKVSLVLEGQMPPAASGGIDSYTKLMLHFDGTGANFVDSELAPTKTITVIGGATQSATQSKFGGKSMYLAATTDYLSTAQSTDFDFGAVDFTIDGWIYPTSIPAGQMELISKATDGTHKWSFNYTQTAIQFWDYTGAGFGIQTVQPYTLTTNAWYHLALVRSANVYTIYVNGTKIGDTYTNSTAVSAWSGATLVGHYHVGYIDEVRVSNGIARWTANFTPPTQNYTQ